MNTNPADKKPLVSVCMITYNHEEFVSQAIEGVLSQKTDFNIELVIGEDGSKDKTGEICAEYSQRFPKKIRLLPRIENLGMMRNFVDALSNCQGKYIAICEGDDYWTDSLKLQKQVDFLEANPDFAVCFHRVKVICEDGDQKPYLSNQNQKEVTTFEDLAAVNYIQTPSCIFRNNLFKEFPPWIYKSPVGDWILHLLNAQYGKVKFMEDVMAVYRMHQGGVWSLTEDKKKLEDAMVFIELCRNYFAPHGKEQFNSFLAAYCPFLCFLLFEEGLYDKFRKYYEICLQAKSQINRRNLLNLRIRYFLSNFPSLAAKYKSWLKKLRNAH